jgi:hypothetical protein
MVTAGLMKYDLPRNDRMTAFQAVLGLPSSLLTVGTGFRNNPWSRNRIVEEISARAVFSGPESVMLFEARLPYT